MEQLLLNIILGNNYENELAYVFNVYKDDEDPMQVQPEANNTKPSYYCPSNINQSSNFLHPWEILFSRSKN